MLSFEIRTPRGFFSGSAVAAFLALTVMFAFAGSAHAQINVGAGTDAACIAACTAAQAQNPPKPCPAPTHITCTSLTVTGVCMIDGCKALSAGGVNGGSMAPGMDQLMSAISKLLGSLGQGGGGSGSGSSPTSASTGCTTGYYQTSNTSLIGVDPCAEYVPSTGSTSGTCTDPTANNYGGTGTCTYNNTGTCDPLSQLLGTCTGSSSGATLTASPQSGPPPLSVTFTATLPTGTLSGDSINFGDGSSPSSNWGTGGGTASASQTYSYANIGTYNATLVNGSGSTLATVSISVASSTATTSASVSVGQDQTVFTNASSSGQVFQVFGSGGFGSVSTTSQGVQVSGTPGVSGNVLLTNSGATIYASSFNPQNNSAVTGFYGGDTFGGAVQNFASGLCQSRPWATNFLSYVIPPSFFDGLCESQGFQVGTPPAVQQTQPQVTLTQQPSQTQTTQQQAPATTTASTATPQVQIWAVPNSVPLGTRTSIFWNSQGVTNCTETSPDGSFSQSSLSGSAATVPITAATTFTMSCMDPNNNPVTDYVTVNLSI